jgi:hypothetical protein
MFSKIDDIISLNKDCIVCERLKRFLGQMNGRKCEITFEDL